LGSARTRWGPIAGLRGEPQEEGEKGRKGDSVWRNGAEKGGRRVVKGWNRERVGKGGDYYSLGMSNMSYELSVLRPDVIEGRVLLMSY